MKRLKNKMKKAIEKLKVFLKDNMESIFVFILFSALTLIVYRFRLLDIFTHYSMPDVDTDGAVWQYATGFFSYGNIPNINTNTLLAYPYGYSFTHTPVFSFIYFIQYIFMQIFGGGEKAIMFFMNFFGLINYPVCGLVTFLLIKKFVKNSYAAFLGSIVFTLSFHNILYARAAISFNQLWVIPLYFLTLVNYIENKSFKNSIYSGLALAFSFGAFPYWAFYSVLVSPFVWLAKEKNILENFKTILVTVVKYFSIVGVITILLNINLLISTFHLTDNANNIASGRGFEPRAQVSCIGCVLTNRYNVPTSEWFIEHGVWMGYVGLFMLPIGLILINKNRSKFLWLTSGFLFSVLLTTYVQGLFWINEIYFKFFFMFKSVSRMNIFASLFLGIISAIVLYLIFKRFEIERKWQITITGMLVIFSVYTNINQDPTFYHRTNYAKLVELYKPIKENKSINVIAGYPMQVVGLVSKDYGVPPMYELIGQSIHKKKLAGGADPHTKNSRENFLAIQNIFATGTVDILGSRGVDTIIIYNNLMASSSELNNILLNDPRLSFIDRYTAEIDDKNYLSQNDMSRDMSVYTIKNVTKINEKDFNQTVKTSELLKFKIGAAISLLTLLICLIYLFRKRKQE